MECNTIFFYFVANIKNIVANLSSAWKSEIIALKVEYSFSTTTTTKQNITHSIQKSDWDDRNWKQLDFVALVTDSWTQFLQQYLIILRIIFARQNC